MFCSKCGKELSDSAKFCNFCGNKIANANEKVVENVNNNNNQIIEEADFTETEVVPFVNEVEVIKNDDDFDDEQTEIIFDRKLPKEKLKTGSKGKIIALVSVFAFLIIAVVGVLIYMNLKTSEKINEIKKAGEEKLAEMQKVGRENASNGKIIYNKGNNVYAKNEIINEGQDSFYYDSEGYLFKGDWVEVNGKWYYCESDGRIAKSKWIEEKYYVDEDGEMMKNAVTPDGYLVGADGIYVPETTPAPTTTARVYYPPAYTPAPIVPPTVPPTIAPTEPIGDTTKEVYIQNYDTYNSYVIYSDTSNSVDISIKYPVFGGHNANEVEAINRCMQSSLDEIESYIDSDVNNEEKAPKNVKITEASVSHIEESKVYVILKGSMTRTGKGSKTVRYRFIYERDTQSSYVNDN